MVLFSTFLYDKSLFWKLLIAGVLFWMGCVVLWSLWTALRTMEGIIKHVGWSGRRKEEGWGGWGWVSCDNVDNGQQAILHSPYHTWCFS